MSCELSSNSSGGRALCLEDGMNVNTNWIDGRLLAALLAPPTFTVNTFERHYTSPFSFTLHPQDHAFRAVNSRW